MALTFLQTATDDTNASSYTFSAQSLGTAASDRYIVVTVGARAGTTETISSVTIGGVTATINVQSTSNNNIASVCIANVPTGATGDIVVTFSGTMDRCGIGAWRATGVTSTTATDTGTSIANPLTTNLDINAGGFAVAIGRTDDIATATWTNLTEKFDEEIGAEGNFFSGASDEFVSAQTNLAVTCTWTTSLRPVFAAASFNVGGTVNTSNFFAVL